MKLKNKVASLMMVGVSALMFCATPILADNRHLAHTVDLEANEQYDYSKICTGLYKIIWGNNSSASRHGVWFVAEYKSDNSWLEDGYARKFLNEGDAIGETSTFHYTTDHQWRLKLDVYGPFTGCQATGYIRNK